MEDPYCDDGGGGCATVDREFVVCFQRNNRGGPSNDHAFSRPPTLLPFYFINPGAINRHRSFQTLCVSRFTLSLAPVPPGRGGKKKEIRSLLARFPPRTILFFSFFLSFSRSVEPTKSIGARFKGLRRKKIELLVDWKRFYYPCVFFYNTFCIIGIFSRKKEIYLIVFKYISLYYSKKIEFLNSAKNLTLYRGIFAGSMEKEIFKKYFHRLKGLLFFSFLTSIRYIFEFYVFL